MVYESDFYTTRRPYSRPTISSYTVTRYGEGNDWDSPYSWPVRREFSRILHRPRPHVGIIYTERFLNSRPLTYFDDETKVIRARAGAILKQLHTPVMKPIPLRLPFQTLDTYSLHPRTTYGVPKHIYQQSFHSEPAHITIGRGHLACVQYAGGKSYPRRKNLYSDENRNIRDEIKFRSYYNRSKHEDSNALPTGFAWRLLHLPPKEVRPFKLYRHSRTLPHLDSSDNKTDKENIEDEGVQKPTHKKYQKRYTESLADLDKIDRTKSYERSDSTVEPISRKKKIEDEAAAKENTSSIDNLTNLTENESQEEIRVEDAIVLNEEVAAPEKKKKKKKDEDISDKPFVNRSYSRTKSIVQDEKPEDTSEKTPLNRSLSRTQSLLKEEKPTPEPKEEIIENEPISEPVVEEAKPEPTFEKEPTPETTEVPVEENVEEKTSVEVSQPDNTQVEPEVEVEEIKPVETNQSPIEEPEVLEETDKESEMFESAPEKESGTDTIVDDGTAENLNIDQSLEAPETKEEVYQDAEVLEDKLEIDSAVKETVSEEIASVEPHNVVSEELQVEESITQQEATENEAVIANAIEESEDDCPKEESNAIVDFSETEASSTKYQSRSDDEGISETRVLEDSFTINSQVQDLTCEVSYTETSTTAYTREETVIHAGDLTTQDSDGLVISEELESSQDALINADQTTDEENVEIQE